MELTEESKFHSRMKYFMKNHKITAEQISSKLDITKGAVTHWSNGIRFPKNDLVISEIANILKVNIVDLFQNSKKNREKIVNEELKNNPEEYLHLIPNALPPILKHIPITKGYPTLNKIVEEQSVPYVNKIYIDKRMIAKHYQEEELEGMVVVGDSMSPYLNHGDVAIYCPNQEPKGSAKYVINTPHGLEVKSLTFLTTGDLSMKTENPAFEDELIKKEDVDTIEILGLVVGRILKS